MNLMRMSLYDLIFFRNILDAQIGFAREIKETGRHVVFDVTLGNTVHIFIYDEVPLPDEVPCDDTADWTPSMTVHVRGGLN
jgi:hypothetical protein